MNIVYSMTVPLIICFVSVFALYRRVDVFDALKDGAYDGLKVIVKIIPSLIALLTAVYMLRASGALDALASLCAPLFNLIGIPPETASLMFIRPISGSGAMAVGSEIIAEHGVDSLIGRTAAVMLSSTETTFYVIAVYFSAAKIKKTRFAVPASLFADFVGFCVASLSVRLLFG